ncbi:hypothetical protein [Aquimarina sp. 2201CG14-23]|nr:hypothetical protein [Aquimarina sp. 2201CG14-23]MDH7444061.1 hypothetical protein [Aquimarina sp. 2201CG14-23]
MSKKQSPTNKMKMLLKQVKTGFKTSKTTINYPTEVHDIFQKRTIT